MRETAIFLASWTATYLAGLLVWTLFTWWGRGQHTTISRTMEYAGQWPIVPALVGLLGRRPSTEEDLSWCAYRKADRPAA